MTWWDDEFRSLPDREWVYRATYKGYLLPVGVKYWWYKIPQDANHKIQIARKTQADSTTIYLYTYPDDNPNWAGANLVEVAPPCSNWSSDAYLITETNRSQTWAIRAAIQSTRELTPKIRAVVALTGELPDVLRQQSKPTEKSLSRCTRLSGAKPPGTYGSKWRSGRKGAWHRE